MKFLKDHPFPVQAFFKRSTVLTFAIPKEQLENMIPECLELDTFQDKWAFIAVAMVQTTGLRPKGFPEFMGNKFFLIGYRIFVRYRNKAGKRLRGLYIIKSETNKKKMEILGNIFTHYNYTTTDIKQTKIGDVRSIHSDYSKFHVDLENTANTPPLPDGSPFSSWKEARRFAGPLPFTFTYDEETKSVLIIEGVRTNWVPNPIKVSSYDFDFIKTLELRNVVLANAFEITNIPYHWKKGKIEKMGLNRKPFQGVFNIIRFNWHFFLIVAAAVILFFTLYPILPQFLKAPASILTIFVTLTTFISLIISYYVYDLSDLYELSWLPDSTHKSLLNINAGFDETSDKIKALYPSCNLSICDFYNPQLHTEVSIKRARRAYPPITGTISVSTNKLPFADHSFDTILGVLSVHEIRDQKERTEFFNELRRITKPTGEILITEHLRDWRNFIAYTIGFLHFHSKSTWLSTFSQANLYLKKEIKLTPFITTFVLGQHGNSL